MTPPLSLSPGMYCCDIHVQCAVLCSEFLAIPLPGLLQFQCTCHVHFVWSCRQLFRRSFGRCSSGFCQSSAVQLGAELTRRLVGCDAPLSASQVSLWCQAVCVFIGPWEGTVVSHLSETKVSERAICHMHSAFASQNVW